MRIGSKKALKWVIAWAGLSLACGWILLAQSPRDSYRSAYAAWRQADPNLERDSAAAQPGFAARVEKVAQGAANYGEARGSFLRASARQDLGPLAEPFNPELELLPNQDLRVFVTGESKVVDGSIKRFENDRDPGIVQWRQALERERLALLSLGLAIDDRRSATAKVAATVASAESARVTAGSQYSQFDAALVQAAGIMDQETAGWAQYYRTLATLAPVKVAPPPPTAGPTTVTRDSSTPESTPPVSLIRYTGTWSFPASGGLFTGVRPEFVDLAVHEENGLLKGSFYGRFTVPAGSGTDPVLRFDFSGMISANRTQSLALETTDGVKGTLELIPGGAFNLLEINFHTDPKRGKLQQGNMVLLKK